MRWVVYLDMDAFYVSCELKRHPELVGTPVAVSADPKGGAGRGVVLSASYEARKFGLRSAMPVRQAYALCPHASWIRPDFDWYVKNSREVMHLLRERAPDARSFSIDEAAYPWEGGSPEDALAEGRTVQRVVRETCALPCSVGIARTLTLGKMASDRAKPGGVVVVPPDGVAAFLAPLKVRAIPGIGAVTEAALAAQGILTIDDLAHAPTERLRVAVGGMARPWRDLARGIVREEPWPVDEGPRSLGAMSTFSEDSQDPGEVSGELERLALSLADDLVKRGRTFRTVTVRTRFSDFRLKQKSRTFPQRTERSEVLRRTVLELGEALLTEEAERVRGALTALGQERPAREGQRPATPGVRTVGVSVSDLAFVSSGQRHLDDGDPEASKGV